MLSRLLPALALSGFGLLAHATPVAALYQTHCAACHGEQRQGAMAPALLPQSLERLRPAEALAVIQHGRPATQMAGFSGTLSAEDIASLAAFIRTEPTTPPRWTAADITASRIEHVKPHSLPDTPRFRADPQNLFLVVEAGTHHVTVLDGDTLTPIHRFKSRFALHGGPKYSRDGRYVFFASRDGWVSKFDLWNLTTVAEIRVGLNTRNLAVSDDGQWVMVGNTLPNTLVLLDAETLSLVKTYPVASERGTPSRVSAVYDAAPRQSFIVALKDLPQVWEIPYAANAPLNYKGFVHDWKMAEGLAVKGQFSTKVIELDAILDDFFFDQSYTHILGASREGKGQVVNLNVRRKIADLSLSGMPHLGSGITWDWQGQAVMASPNLKEGKVSVIEMKNWQTVAEIPTNGPGFFMRSHEATPYAWVDAMMSPRRDTLQIIDKRTLKVVGSVTPSPGKTAAHVEFTRDGRYALVSLMENEGALVIYDAATWQEVKRLPMDKPIGKYNVFNKTTRSAGTSH